MDNETTINNFINALNGEAHECGVIKTSEIIFLKEVREICKGNECGNYNKYWGCPPPVGSFDEMVKKHCLMIMLLYLQQ
jgi:predicted metal-binding protein